MDLLKTIFTFGTPSFFELSQRIRLNIFEQAAKEDIPGIVFTFVYEKLTDDLFIERLLELVTSNGGRIVFIQIYCERDELLRRVTQESRKKFQKVKSEKSLLAILDAHDQMSSIDFVESHKIDSTHLTVAETASRVLQVIQ